MFKIRQIKYSADAVSIQGFKIENGKRVIIRHIGNARNEQGKADLLTLAKDFIERITRQLNLFGNDQASNLLYLNQTGFLGVYYTFMHDLLSKLLTIIGLDKIKSRLLLDLVILRMIEPASKLRPIDARLKKSLTGKEMSIRTQPPPEILQLLEKLNLLT